MWVLTPWGPLMPSLRKNCPADDPRTIQIRFRRVKDAIRCSQVYLRDTVDADSPIVEDAGTDYDARIYVRPESLQWVMYRLCEEIDYTSFKDQTTIKYHDRKLHDAYYAIWQVLYDRLSTRKAFSRGRKTYWAERRRSEEQTRIPDEIVYRTENNTREWHMKGATPEEMATLMREIDAATGGIEVPTDAEIDAMGETLQNDHSDCAHSDSKSARKRCNKARRTW